jgi:hypothetical protein
MEALKSKLQTQHKVTSPPDEPAAPSTTDAGGQAAEAPPSKLEQLCNMPFVQPNIWFVLQGSEMPLRASPACYHLLIDLAGQQLKAASDEYLSGKRGAGITISKLPAGCKPIYTTPALAGLLPAVPILKSTAVYASFALLFLLCFLKSACSCCFNICCAKTQATGDLEADAGYYTNVGQVGVFDEVSDDEDDEDGVEMVGLQQDDLQLDDLDGDDPLGLDDDDELEAPGADAFAEEEPKNWQTLEALDDVEEV